MRELQRAELKEAAQLLGRGMRDNPANVWAFDMRVIAIVAPWR